MPGAMHGWRSAPRLAALLLLATALAAVLQPSSAADINDAPRVRKELRSLDAREYRALAKALGVLMTVPTEEGQQLYGPDYKEWSYFIVKHGVSVTDPRGNQGHTSGGFMTFHRTLLLEMESALLSVAPELKALPYWDITLDNPDTGRYFGTPDYIFSERWAGPLAPPNTTEPIYASGGLLGTRPQVFEFDWETYGDIAWIYNGSLTTGLLRDPHNTSPDPYILRWPAANLQSVVMPPTFLYDTIVELSNNFEGWAEGLMMYTPQQYDTCTTVARVGTSYLDWLYCVDLGSVPQDRLDEANNTALFHIIPHWIIGSRSLEGADSADFPIGDFGDVTTSPCEALLFFAHHANADRSLMTWQTNMAKEHPELVAEDPYYGFPAEPTDDYSAPEGTFLYDVINSNFNFSSGVFAGEVNPSGYTHAEILDKTRPGLNAPYTYDSLTS